MAGSSPKRMRSLLVLLLVLGGVYVALLPWLRRLNAETERINREQRAAKTLPNQIVSTKLDEAHAAVTRAPNDPQARLNLASLFSEMGNLREAAAQAETVVRLRPTDTAALLFLAQVYQRDHRYDPAIQTYRALLALSPDDSQAAAGLSLIYLAFGWTSDARSVLERAIRAAPSDLHLKVALALVAVQHSDYHEAEKQLLLVRRLAPENAALWIPLIDLYIKSHRFTDAIKVSQDALAQMPNDVRLLNGMGQAFLDSGDAANAEAAFRRVLDLDRDNIVAHHRLALCAKAARNPQDAVRHLEYVEKRAPEFEKTRLLLGQLYLQLHRTEEGQRLLREYESQRKAAQKHSRIGLIVSMNPKSADAHWQMALLYKEENDTPRMVVELRKTVELKPDHAGAKRLLKETARVGGQGS